MPVALYRQIANVSYFVFHGWWGPLSMLIIGASIIRGGQRPSFTCQRRTRPCGQTGPGAGAARAAWAVQH
jgi:hypothetical protein